MAVDSGQGTGCDKSSSAMVNLTFSKRPDIRVVLCAFF